MSGCPNYTEGPQLLSSTEKPVVVTLYTTLAVLALTGNSLVLYIVFHFPRMRTATNYFIANLACADILMAITCIPFSYWPVLILQFWPFGNVMCKIVSFGKVFAIMLNAHTLVTISVDRFVAILSPLRRPMTAQSVLTFLGILWVIAFAIGLPVLVVQNSKAIEIAPNTSVYHCTESWSSPSGGFYYSTSILVLQYFLPLLILSVSYCGIAAKLCFARTLPDDYSVRMQRKSVSVRRLKTRRVIIMMATVSINYALCWLPQNIFNILWTKCHSYTLHPKILYIWWGCHFVAMCQSFINPCVYFCSSQRYQEGLLFVFRWLPFVRYRPSEISHSFVASSTRPRLVGGNNNSLLGNSSTSRSNKSNKLTVPYSRGTCSERSVRFAVSVADVLEDDTPESRV